MASEYIIYADESTSQGRYYSNFYGGALVRSTDLRAVEVALEKVKADQNLFREVKWNKVTSNYLTKYIVVVDAFFDLIEADKIKTRIMFSRNAYEAANLNPYQRDNSYFLLYYQFIKHAFGLRYSNPEQEPIGLRLYLDRIADTKEKVARFRGYLLGLNKWTGFRDAHLWLKEDGIAEVDSHDHVILQTLDIVLGAMQFRLNDLHKQKPEGAIRRGKRTMAKDELYHHIRGRICRIRPNFNIGITTGRDRNAANLWHHSYRHWCFHPKDGRFDGEKTKRG